MRLEDMAEEHVFRLVELMTRLEMQPVNDADKVRLETLEDDSSPPDLRLLAFEGDEVTGFCLACVRGSLGVIKLFGVHPAWQRQGIATALFAEVEARLARRGVTEFAVEGVAPHSFFPGVELTRTAAISFLMRRGYHTNREARVDMRVDLERAALDTAGERRSLAQRGIALRRASAEDLGPVSHFISSHFSEHWRIEVGDAARFQPLPLYIAATDKGVVGFAAYDVTGPSRFGPMGTDPQYRGRGIGGALLRMCLADMRERGDRQAEIVWVGPIPFYAKVVGAQIHRAYWCFRKEAPQSTAA